MKRGWLYGETIHRLVRANLWGDAPSPEAEHNGTRHSEHHSGRMFNKGA